MSLEKTLQLKGLEKRGPIFQGGMGIGVSLEPLATAVGKFGDGKQGIGTISTVCMDQYTPRRLVLEGETVDYASPGRMDFIEAVRTEISDTKMRAGVVAVNIMCALPLFYERSIEGAVKGGVNAIVSGAGLPLKLPNQVKKYTGKSDHEINLIPIVSSAKALEIICKRWGKQGYRPDAVVLEGPKAGGHIGWSYKEVKEAGKYFLKKFDLFDALLDPVLDIAKKYPNDFGPIPVVPAGGIYTHEDIKHALSRGASGVQLGTRFAMTHESGWTDEVKQAVIATNKEDIVLTDLAKTKSSNVITDISWASPCGYPFRISKKSPLYLVKQGNYFCICSGLMGATGIDNTKLRGTEGFPRGCPERYVLLGKDKVCQAAGNIDYSPLITCGTEAYRIDKILSVEELMTELIG